MDIVEIQRVWKLNPSRCPKSSHTGRAADLTVRQDCEDVVGVGA